MNNIERKNSERRLSLLESCDLPRDLESPVAYTCTSHCAQPTIISFTQTLSLVVSHALHDYIKKRLRSFIHSIMHVIDQIMLFSAVIM